MVFKNIRQFLVLLSPFFFTFPDIAIANIKEAYLSQVLVGQVGAGSCGDKPFSLELYEQVSQYSLYTALFFVVGSIVVEKKLFRKIFGVLAVFPFVIWIYVHFFVNFEELQKMIFNYNVRAESTLANIAEAQDRYKSEHDIFIKDLGQIKSHLAGAHGIDECVEVLSLEVAFDHWTAEAKHVSSPEKVHWDSTYGSSLKKG